ncbi:transmembrane protein 125 [Fundulus diaphanus]
MPEMQTLYYGMRRPPSLYLDPFVTQQQILEDEVQFWWFQDPRRSLFCYCAQVAVILGLGLGGVGLLSTTNSLSVEWRLGVGTTLCLLALAVLLKQLLSSAIQDMNCVHSRRQIEQLRSGGRADPALILAVGLSVILCGAVLLCVAKAGGRSHDGREMSVSGAVLVAAGASMSLAVVGYNVMVHLESRRNQRMRRRLRIRRARRLGGQAVRVFSVSPRQMSPAGRDASTSRTSLI